MGQHSRRTFVLCGTALALSACSLPRGAPSGNELLAGSDAEDPGFAVYRVTRAFLPQLDAWPATGTIPNDGWIARQPGPASSVIAPGDRLDLRIWDSEDNSLITSPEQKSADMAGMAVSPSGYLFVPYVEQIHVAGLTPDRARARIQEKMTAIVPSAQVQLHMQPGRRNSVDLVGGVGSPGRYPLPDRDSTVLNMISEAGGVSPALTNPRVRLIRGGKVYLATLTQLYADPRSDTTLRGGDKVIVEAEDRYFVALGATGREEIIIFPRHEVSALEAISLIGGLSDSRADPKGILVLRRYPPEALAAGQRGPREERVVFSLDLTDADGLFSAGTFQIRSGDVVFGTESPVTGVRTILQLIGSALGTVGAANTISN